MDEPFTGLDPVNLVLLREAFIELRDRGRTLIFSTHQMEAAEALCESVAIVDHGRLVAGGRVRDLKRASGRRTVRLAVDGRARRRLAGRPARRRSASGRTPAGPSSSSCPAPTRRRSWPRSSTRGAIGAPVRGRRAEPRGALHRARRPAVRRRMRSSRPMRAAASLSAGGGRLMARRDPLLPNAGIVARREYRDRTRSPLFLGSTVLLAILAMMVAVAPIGIRYMDRQTVTRIAVVSADPDLGQRRCHRRRQPAQHAAGRAPIRRWERPYAVEVVLDEDPADAAAATRRARRDPRRRTGCRAARSSRVPDHRRRRTVPAARSSACASFGIGVLDWSVAAAAGRRRSRSRPRASRSTRSTSPPMAAKPLDAQQAASRALPRASSSSCCCSSRS